MQAAVFEIARKKKAGELNIARLEDFSLRPGGAVSARIVIDRPQITLYCLNDEHRQAVFVETPPDVDLTQHPFYCQAQYEHAERILLVPYDASVGRCGSTLLSRAFGRVDSVQSLSQPDVYTQIAAMRPKNGSRDGELTQLIRSCTRLLNRSAGRQAGVKHGPCIGASLRAAGGYLRAADQIESFIRQTAERGGKRAA